jgi:Spy/CpxP family protein refolding chaperone
MRITRTLFIAALATSLATPVLAGPEHGSHERGPRGIAGYDGDSSDAVLHMMLRATRELDLSAEQQTSIRTIADAAREQLNAASKAAGDNRKALHEVLTADTLDEAALEQAADSAGALVSQRIMIAARAARDMRAELTPEQVAQLETLREEHMAKLRAQRKSRDDA